LLLAGVVLRFLGLTAAPAAILAAVAHDAHAMGAVVTSPPGASSMVEARIAVAIAAPDAAPPADAGEGALTRTTRWASLRVHGQATSLAWIVPVHAGARVDLASDAWLEALDEASAPRVVPPDTSPPCGIAAGVEIEGDRTHPATVAPDAVVVAPDGASVAMALAAWGFVLPRDLAAAVDAAAAAGEAFVAMRFATLPASAPAADLRTRTVRITEDAPFAVSWSLAGLSLAGGDGSSLALTAHAMGAGPVAWGAPGAATPLQLDPASILWDADGTSTYAAARDALLQAQPARWLEETAGRGILFRATPVPGEPSVPALVGAYFGRAHTYGDAADDPDTCAAHALAVATSASTVAPACAPGALAVVGLGAPCEEVVGAGQIAPDVLRCGGSADDLALALSGLAPGSAYLSRGRSIIPAGVFGQDVPLHPTAGAEHGPVVTAAGYDPPCGAAEGGSSATGAGELGVGAGTGAAGAIAGAGANSGYSGGTDVPADPVAVVDPGVGGACGGDSSSSESGDSCGGDSSSSSSSSSSSDESSSSNDGCGGNSSGSDSSSNDSCGGSGGSGSSSGSNDCSTGGRRSHGRSPVSRILLSMALIAGLSRRASRRRPAGLDSPAPVYPSSSRTFQRALAPGGDTSSSSPST
jgi:hypothetical protein